MPPPPPPLRKTADVDDDAAATKEVEEEEPKEDGEEPKDEEEEEEAPTPKKEPERFQYYSCPACMQGCLEFDREEMSSVCNRYTHIGGCEKSFCACCGLVAETAAEIYTHLEESLKCVYKYCAVKNCAACSIGNCSSRPVPDILSLTAFVF